MRGKSVAAGLAAFGLLSANVLAPPAALAVAPPVIDPGALPPDETPGPPQEMRQTKACVTPVVVGDPNVAQPDPGNTMLNIEQAWQYSTGAGVTVAIIREDLLARSPDNLPGYLNFNNHVKEDSMWNTPPCFAIYILGLVAKWLKHDIGGLAKMYELNQQKAKMLYDVIDASRGFYQGHALPQFRSLMNVTFRLPSEELENRFVEEAAKNRLDGLKGHRSVGGIRASIYNAFPLKGVETLVEFMKDFAQRNG